MHFCSKQWSYVQSIVAVLGSELTPAAGAIETRLHPGYPELDENNANSILGRRFCSDIRTTQDKTKWRRCVQCFKKFLFGVINFKSFASIYSWNTLSRFLAPGPMSGKLKSFHFLGWGVKSFTELRHALHTAMCSSPQSWSVTKLRFSRECDTLDTERDLSRMYNNFLYSSFYSRPCLEIKYEKLTPSLVHAKACSYAREILLR